MSLSVTTARAWIAIALGIFAAAACTSPPIRTGYLDNFNDLKGTDYLDGVWFDDSAVRNHHYVRVELVSVRAVGVSDQDHVTVADATEWLHEAVVQPGTTSTVLTDNRSGPAANLELVISELDPGSTVARFLAGEFGAGHAWVQVEGKLTDGDNGALVGTLVQRTRASGVAALRNSRGYDSGPGLVHDIIREIGRNIRGQLAATLKMPDWSEPTASPSPRLRRV